MTGLAETRDRPDAQAVVQRFRNDGYDPLGSTLYLRRGSGVGSGSEKAGTTELSAVLPVLRNETFDTVLGHLGFDERGDIPA